MTGRTLNLRATCVLFTLLTLTGPLARAARAATVPGNYPTIQSAVSAVIAGSLPDGTTIDIQPGTYPETIFIANTNRSFTLRAVGAVGSVIVDAAGKGTSALTVFRSTGQVVIKGLTFRHGTSTTVGGGFFIQESSPTLVDCIFELGTASAGAGGFLRTSNAAFTRCTIRNNVASSRGGGVLMQDGSKPVFTACNIMGNVAGTTNNAGVGGGVESVESSPTFKGCIFNGNSSMFAGGGIYHTAPFGSGYGTATLLIEDSEISDNVTTPFSAGDNPAEGGGMHIEDNAIATLNRVRVLRNRANTGGGLNAYRARYDIVDSLIDSNQATGRADGGFGGGITASSTNVTSPAQPASIVHLTRTLVRRNTSLTGGGIVVTGDVGLPATLTLQDSVVDSNTTQSQGGGVLLSRTNMTAANSMIIRNSVAGTSTAFGGGLLASMLSTATLSGTTIAHNTSASFGGGMFLDQGVALSITGSRIYDNTAGGRGGGVFVGPNGSQSGSIQSSIIADNSDAQINEDACSSITYTGNTITPKSGTVQFSGCAPGGRASGNNSNVPVFAHVLAVPGNGVASTIVWVVARATSVTVSGVGNFSNQPTGSVDVTPAGSTTYSLTASTPSGNVGPVNVTFNVVTPPTGGGSGRSTDGDFNGDHRSDLTVFRPADGTFYTQFTSGGSTSLQWGNGNDKPVVGDYNGDGKADAAIFRPVNGTWYISFTGGGGTSMQWGNGNDKPVPADYDGDGKTDIAIFRPADGTWYIVNSSNGGVTSLQWGNGNDIPVPGDYDGDGKADIAIFRPADGNWYVHLSSNGATMAIQWGNGNDIPVPGDYDGDGKTDIAIFRPADGKWYILSSQNGAVTAVQWGNGNDTPLTGDFDGDGKTDIAIFRPADGKWYILSSQNGSASAIQWGNGTDIPILKRR